MGQKYMDSAKAAAEADRIAALASHNLKQALSAFRSSLQVVSETRRMLEVDPECVCVSGSECKWERRTELHAAADSIQIAMELLLRNFLKEIETSLVDTPEKPLPVGDNDANLLWCHRVCVHEKVDMDSTLWCHTPQTILELVFARLPLHQIFQLRGLSKHWRSSIMSPSFQNAFGTTTSRRFAIIAGTVRKRLWSFGTTERKWYTLPFDFLPTHCDFPVAGDGGLLCCRRPTLSNQVKQDLQLYVCNPLTRAWRKLPLPCLVQEFDLVHLFTDTQTKQYTITVVNDLQQNQPGEWNAKAIVEVYDSATNTWTASNGIFREVTKLVYYKKYVDDEFFGIRAYDKTTGCTSIPLKLPDDIFFSEDKGFFPLAEYQGQIYLLQTEVATSGVWVLRGHGWEKICSVPKPELLKFYLFSLYVSGDVIIVFGEQRIFHDDIDTLPAVADPDEPEKPYSWMLDRSQGKWINVVDHELDSVDCSQIVFEMSLDGIP